MKMLDTDYRVRSDSRILSIPIVRQLEKQELESLEYVIQNVTVQEEEFEERIRIPSSLDEVLEKELPAELLGELPRSLDIVGDVAIVELKALLAPFQQEIGRAVLNLHSNVRAVFAKVGPVSGSVRVRPLLHIGGENRTRTVQREFGCSFKVDLTEAYFSPRLSTEHERVAKQVLDGERVVDLFAGVGPFSILIAKRVGDVKIDAVDSNPAAIGFVRENIRANKVESKIRVHLGDAGEVAGRLGPVADRVVMNHPSESKNFVRAACNLLRHQSGTIHYYTFSWGDDSENVAKSELETAVTSSGYHLGSVVGVRKVREVAPMNWQIVVDARIGETR